MAWAGIIIGMFAGILTASAGYWVVGLPLWVSLLFYPLAGTVVAMAVIALLLLRSSDIGSGPRPFSGDTAPAPA